MAASKTQNTVQAEVQIKEKYKDEHPLVEFLNALPAASFARLYLEPSATLTIFRWLPKLAQYIVCRLLYLQTPMPLSIIRSWTPSQYKGLQTSALLRLKQWQVLQGKENNVWLNTSFREQYIGATTESGPKGSFLMRPATIDKFAVNHAYLVQISKEQYERLLQYMVGDTESITPNPGIGKLLVQSGLMSAAQSAEDNDEDQDILDDSARGQLHITHAGFSFLLKSQNVQLWTLLIHYMGMSETLGLEKMELLILLFKLGFTKMGWDYDVEGLTESQFTFLQDLRDLGLVFQRKSSSRRFYPTRLSQQLNVCQAAHEQSACENAQFIIVETNFKVYAYTSSPLQISILGLFVSIKTRFPNFTCGVLSRESVQDALKHGLTADQMITYLSDHAHPEMQRQAKTSVLPSTLIDQIKLWELEKKRIQMADAVLYLQFLDAIEYDRVYRYAQELGGVGLAVPSRRLLVVKAEAHPLIKAYMKSIR